MRSASRTARTRRPATIESFRLDVCGMTGDPGCLDCCEGHCDGLQFGVVVTYHRCTECHADDVYGEIVHEDSCSLSPQAAERAEPADAERAGGTR